jgi:NADPH:quinone reductase-like Zn-dependent oxidoreductase
MVHACGVRTAGGPVEGLDLPEPAWPGPGEVLLTVEAAGVGPWDALLHTGGWDVGLRPPAALGVEGAGRVTAVGEGVATVAVGDGVLVHEAPLPGGSGFWAEHVLVTVAHVAVRPAGLDVELAGGLPVAGLTALQALNELELGPDSRLLITGGSGSTGAVAVQLAAQARAEVIATAAPRHVDRLRHPGAAEVIDSHTPNWVQNVDGGFDAILAAAKGTASAAIALLRDGGRLCSITSDAPAEERGIRTANLYVRPEAGQLAHLASLAAGGRIELDRFVTTLDE